jgi:hypothetical protein
MWAQANKAKLDELLLGKREVNMRGILPDIVSRFRRLHADDQGDEAPPPGPPTLMLYSGGGLLEARLVPSEGLTQNRAQRFHLKLCATSKERFDRIHVKIESGTQVASRGPTWRNATPLV